MRILTATALLVFVMILPGVGAREQFNPERFGIGAEIVREDSSSAIWVRSCLENGPADRAGVKPGDVLIELDGRDTSKWSLQDVVRYLTRDQPLPVHMTLRRESAIVSVQMVRERFSDMGRAAGVVYKMAPDSSGYTVTPLEERKRVEKGEVVEFGVLRDLRCEKCGPRADSGRRTLIYFWATWCGPCKTLIAQLDDSTVKLGRSRLVGINVDGDCEVFQSAAAAIQPPGEQFWAGWYGDLTQTLGVRRTGVPTGAVIDENGRLLGVSLGVDSVLTLFREFAR